MKASEFVAQIQALIAEHGDLEVLTEFGLSELQVAEVQLVRGGGIGPPPDAYVITG